MPWCKKVPIGSSLMFMEAHFIVATLEVFDGNRTHTARALGITPKTLRRKLTNFEHKYGPLPIPPPRFNHQKQI